MKTLKLKIINFFTKGIVSHDCEEHYKIKGFGNIIGNHRFIPIKLKCKVCGNIKYKGGER